MPERQDYIPGVPCWADTSQPDPQSEDFYRGLFGWELEDVMPPESDGNYFMGRLRGLDVAAVGSIPDGALPMAMWNSYIRVDSADETAAKVRDAGGNVAMEPFDIEGSGRMGVFIDPEGAAICVWEPKGFEGSRLVNEHGTVNFNGLNTRDLEAAKPFYRAVFGWTSLPCRAARRCGRCRATATTWSATTPVSASRSSRSAARRASRTSSRASIRSPTTSPTRPHTGA